MVDKGVLIHCHLFINYAIQLSFNCWGAASENPWLNPNKGIQKYRTMNINDKGAS